MKATISMLQLSTFIKKSGKGSSLLIQKINSEIGRKLYVPLHISFLGSKSKRITSMIDSGSDISIMQLEYFLKLFPEFSEPVLMKNLEKTEFTLTSYTNHRICIKGLAKINFKLLKDETAQTIDVFIVDSNNRKRTKSPVILSLAALSKFNININFGPLDNIEVPSLVRGGEFTNKIIPSYYQTDSQLSIAHGVVDELLPKQSLHAYFIVPPSSPYLPGDLIMVTQDQIPYEDQKMIRVIPSTSKIEVIGDEYIVQAYVQNDGKNIFNGVILCSLDLIDSAYKINKISKNVKKLKTAKISLLSECRLPSENKSSMKYITIKQPLDDNDEEEQVVNNKLYSLDLIFPEQTPDLPSSTAINNDVDFIGKALSEERYHVHETSQTLSKDELEAFEDPKQGIQLGYKSEPPELTFEDLQPVGISIPTSILETPEDLIKEEDFEPLTWPYVKRIFLETYPDCVSRHSLDRGNLSLTLGHYEIRLKPNVVLPKYKKLYYLDKEGSSMLRDILEFLVKTNVISKAPCSGGDLSQFASPCFLVRRSNTQQAARLVVNFKLINECVSVEPITLNTFDNILNQLQGSVLYSCIDLKSAFNSIELSPESKQYAMFNSQFGCYYFNTLCTGMITSPNALSRFCDMMLNHVPKLDSKGEIMYNDKGYPIMEADYLDGICIYYDDIIIFTPPESTYARSLEQHFILVEKIVKRLSFHRAKLEMAKAKFGVARIQFLGWNISNGFLQADPKRVEKIQETPFPENKTKTKSYLGLLNSLRHTLHFDILNKIHILTPLTSTKHGFLPTEEQREAFKEMNKKMGQGPLYSKICVPGSPKILMTDCASERNSQYACVLAQIVPSKTPNQTVPFHLFLDDPGHRIIYDTKTPVRPIPLRQKDQTTHDYLVNLKVSHPPEMDYLKENTLGYGENVGNSLGSTLDLILLVHNCSTSFLEHCEKLNEFMGKHIVKHQFIDDEFHGDEKALGAYRKDVCRGIIRIDKNLHIFQALAQSMNRTLKLINTTDFLGGKPIIAFPAGLHKPPFFMILYKRDGHYIVRPTLLELHSEYSLAKHRGSFEIILYHSQNIPHAVRRNKIMDLELYSLLSSLKAVEKLVGGDELLCLTDNKPLYYLFHSDSTESYSKIQRWSKKLIEQYPLMKLGFISSRNNLSDWLSRMYQVSTPEVARTHLPDHVSNILDDYIPQNKIWSISEWKTWVQENPSFLEYVTPVKKKKFTQVQNEQQADQLTPDPGIRDLEVNRITQTPSGEARYLSSSYKKGKLSFKKDDYLTFKTILLKELDSFTFAKENDLQKIMKKRPKDTFFGIDELGICKIKLHIKETKMAIEDLSAKVFGSNLSTKMARRNINAVYNPIRALEEILSTDRIITEQQEEYKETYDKCAKSPDKSITKDKDKYQIELGLLYIEKNGQSPRMVIPSKLLPMYVGQAHLATNHSSTQKLLLNLTNYYHPQLQSYCTKFANTCMACLLVNHSTKTQKLGIFPLDGDVFSVVHMDLIESLPTSSGFPHVLVVKDPISNFILMIPMVGKTAKEFIHVFEKVIYPPFHPRAAYTDNASFFIAEETITALALLGTTVIYSSAFSGASHGGIERYVGFFKTIFKKNLSIEPNYNWTSMTSTIAHLHNTTKLNKSGYSPAEIVFGPDNHLSTCILDTPGIPKIHPAVKNKKGGLEKKFQLMKSIKVDTRDKIILTRDKQINRLNKTRITRQLEVGDIVLIKDHSQILGSTRPLKTRYLHSPFIIVHIMPSTTIIRRISDSWVTGRHKDDLKRYIPLAPEFKDLPDIVKRICEQTVHELTEKQLEELIKIDDLDHKHYAPHKEDPAVIKEFLQEFDEVREMKPLSKTEIEETLLNEDQDEEYTAPLTRSQLREKVAKQLQFDPSTKPE